MQNKKKIGEMRSHLIKSLEPNLMFTKRREEMI